MRRLVVALLVTRYSRVRPPDSYVLAALRSV